MRALVPNQSTLERHPRRHGGGHTIFSSRCDLLIVGRLEWADFIPTPEQDMYLLEKVIAGICDAVKTGRISQERLVPQWSAIPQIETRCHLKPRYNPFSVVLRGLCGSLNC